jgi:hypothetical protein
MVLLLQRLVTKTIKKMALGWFMTIKEINYFKWNIKTEKKLALGLSGMMLEL